MFSSLVKMSPIPDFTHSPVAVRDFGAAGADRYLNQQLPQPRGCEHNWFEKHEEAMGSITG